MCNHQFHEAEQSFMKIFHLHHDYIGLTHNLCDHTTES